MAWTGGNITGYSITYFLPSILKGFQYSPISTQLHSVPPFAAAYVFSLVVSFASAKARHRLDFVLFPLFLALAGVGTLLNVHSNVQVEYAGTFLITMGPFRSFTHGTLLVHYEPGWPLRQGGRFCVDDRIRKRRRDRGNVPFFWPSTLRFTIRATASLLSGCAWWQPQR